MSTRMMCADFGSIRRKFFRNVVRTMTAIALAISTPVGPAPTMTNVIKKIDDNSFSWQTIERTAGGEILPNINEVVIVRE